MIINNVFCQLFNENFGINNECRCQTDNQSVHVKTSVLGNQYLTLLGSYYMCPLS